MALQGTIDDFPLTDVLSLLAASSRSGRLVLEGDRGTATLVIDQGRVVGGGPGRDGAEARDLVFEILRHREGSFGFEATDPDVDPDREVDVDPRPVGSCLDEAGQLLVQWREIEAVVPTPACGIRLVGELQADTIELDAEDWRLIAAVGDGRTVDTLRERLDVDEFSLCARIAELVRSDLVVVDEEAAFDGAGFGDAGFGDAAFDDAGFGDAAFDDAANGGPEPIPGDTGASGGFDEPLDGASGETSVGWLLAEDAVGDDAAGVDDHDAGSIASELDAEQARASTGVPDRFPIDDLLGGPGEVDDDPWSSPEMVQLDQQRAEPVAELIEFEPVPLDGPAFQDQPFEPDAVGVDAVAGQTDAADSADEVLRQMSKLSPEAAEAIAAALNSPPSTGGTRSEGPDDDGPVTYLGTL